MKSAIWDKGNRCDTKYDRLHLAQGNLWYLKKIQTQFVFSGLRKFSTSFESQYLKSKTILEHQIQPMMYEPRYK